MWGRGNVGVEEEDGLLCLVDRNTFRKEEQRVWYSAAEKETHQGNTEEVEGMWAGLTTQELDSVWCLNITCYTIFCCLYCCKANKFNWFIQQNIWVLIWIVNYHGLNILINFV